MNALSIAPDTIEALDGLCITHALLGQTENHRASFVYKAIRSDLQQQSGEAHELKVFQN